MDVVLGVVLGEGFHVSGLPLLHPAVHGVVLLFQGGLKLCFLLLGQVPGSVHPLEHGQSHGQVVLLKFVRQVIENFPLEGVGLHPLHGHTRIGGLGVDIQVQGHGVFAGGIVGHGQGGKGVGQRPGLILGHLLLGHAQGGQGIHHLLVQLRIDVVL